MKDERLLNICISIRESDIKWMAKNKINPSVVFRAGIDPCKLKLWQGQEVTM